jgi:N-dimethylarginine dimethylaminohydrolase
MSVSSSAIMADPRYFDVRYSINPLTSLHGEPVRPEKARAQWTRLAERLEEAGVSVSVAGPPPIEHPDFVFVKDAVLLVGRHAIMARFAHAERRGEDVVVAEWLRRQGYTIHELPEREGLFFEGGGDARWSHGGQHLWLAYGQGRTSRAGAEEVRRLVRILTPDVSVHLLRIVSPRTYHLDLCFLPIGERRVLVQYGSFAAAGLSEIARVFGATGLIRVPPRYLFACNSVVVPAAGVLIAPKVGAEGYRTWLARKTGMRIVEVNVSEFQKAGGAVACMVLPVD